MARRHEALPCRAEPRRQTARSGRHILLSHEQGGLICRQGAQAACKRSSEPRDLSRQVADAYGELFSCRKSRSEFPHQTSLLCNCAAASDLDQPRGSPALTSGRCLASPASDSGGNPPDRTQAMLPAPPKVKEASCGLYTRHPFLPVSGPMTMTYPTEFQPVGFTVKQPPEIRCLGLTRAAHISLPPEKLSPLIQQTTHASCVLGRVTCA